MTEFQTVAARLAGNLLNTNQSNYAGAKTTLEIEFVVYTLLRTLDDVAHSQFRELISEFVANFIDMLQANNEALHLVLKKEITTQQYMQLELENYKKLADYIAASPLTSDLKSVIMGYLIALDTDALRTDGDAYLIDEYQHSSVMQLRKEWFLNMLGVNHTSFAVYFNTAKES